MPGQVELVERGGRGVGQCHPAAGKQPLLAGTVDDGRLVLGHDHLAGAAQHIQPDAVQPQAGCLADDPPTGEYGDVAQYGLPAVAEAGRPDRDRP